jgi:curli production assembly/transport component CsgG
MSACRQWRVMGPVGDILRRRLMISALGASALSLSACAGLDGAPQPGDIHAPPVLAPLTESNRLLRRLPRPAAKVRVAVYGFSDQTGQMKASETVQTYSRAVTQGGASILVKALLDAGAGRWFTVIEREKIDSLARERGIIAEARRVYNNEQTINAAVLPPLTFAGILLDGGVIGYDFDTHTGGLAARYLGIGGDASYRQDMVTVSLRAISTRSGEVLAAVVVHKTIASVKVEGGINKYISSASMLEGKADMSRDEPGQIAVQEAIEKAVHALIIDGAARGLWSFRNRGSQARLVAEYRKEQFGASDAEAGVGKGRGR